MRDMAGVVLLLAVTLFEGTLPAVVSEEIMQRLPRSLTLWVERYGQHSALNNFTGDKYSLLLHREFIREEDVWRDLRRRRIFPLHRPNHPAKALKPGLASHLAAGWSQGVYVARRLAHHSKAALTYGWERYRWERIRSAGP